MESVHKRNHRNSETNTAPAKAVESVYLAVDPETKMVHSMASVESIPSQSTFSRYNNPELSTYKENEQLPLFKEDRYPGEFNTLILEGSERGRTHTMNLLAIAKARHEKFVGPTEVIPADSLSKHSYKLVSNLKNRGLVKDDVDPFDFELNDYDFAPDSGIADLSYYAMYNTNEGPDFIFPSEVPTEDVKAGKEELRRFLGRTPKPKSAPPVNQDQFEQLKLDGL